VSRATKGQPTGLNLSVLLDYIDERRESIHRPLPKRPTVGMQIDLRFVPATSAPHLRRCIAAGLIVEQGSERGIWVLTQKGVDMLREHGAAYPTLDQNRERWS
jgi:hypothetical protein